MSTKKKELQNHGLGALRGLAWGVLIGLVWVGGVKAQRISSQLEATLIDRQGNKHEVSRFTYQGGLRIEYYVGNQRRVVPLADIDRLRFEGERGREEIGLVVTLRTGRQETGTILTGSGIMPHEDALGVGGGAARFSGTTELGPLDMLLSEVREVVMRHSPTLPPPREEVLKATLITLAGERFEVEDVQFRGRPRLYYGMGSRRRFVDLEKVARIDFGEGGADGEIRPLTIVYWSGRTVQGNVDAGTVRLAGETDRNYYERVHAAFTGRLSAGGDFSIGLHRLKQIRFHPQDESESDTESDTESEAEAPTPETPSESD